MKYYLTISSKNKYVWFQNTKCASTTIREYLSKYTQIDEEYQQDWIRSEYFLYNILTFTNLRL